MKTIITILASFLTTILVAQTNQQIVDQLLSEQSHYNFTVQTPNATTVHYSFWSGRLKYSELYSADYLEFRSREVLKLFNSQPQFFGLQSIAKGSVEDAGNLIAKPCSYPFNGKEYKAIEKIVISINNLSEEFSGCVWIVTYKLRNDAPMTATWPYNTYSVGYSAVTTNFFSGSLVPQQLDASASYETTLGTTRIFANARYDSLPQLFTVIVYDDVQPLTKHSTANAPLCFGSTDSYGKYVHVQKVNADARLFQPVRANSCSTPPQQEQPVITDQTAEFWSNADSLLVSFFDNGTEDGDRVAISVNGQLLLPDFNLTNDEQGFVIPNSHPTHIELKVLDEGYASPCTVTFKVQEYKKKFGKKKEWGPYDLKGKVHNPKYNKLKVTIN